MQCYFWSEDNAPHFGESAHIYEVSTNNQRVENWRSHFWSLTHSMHNVPLALGFDQNQPQVAQIESLSVISKGVILKALCTNLMDLRTRICLKFRKRKKRLFCEHN